MSRTLLTQASCQKVSRAAATSYALIRQKISLGDCAIQTGYFFSSGSFNDSLSVPNNEPTDSLRIKKKTGESAMGSARPSPLKIHMHTDLATGLAVSYPRATPSESLLLLTERYEKKVAYEISFSGQYKELFDRLKRNITSCQEYATTLDFEDIQCNGVRMLLHHAELYISVASKKKRARDVKDFMPVIKILDTWFDVIAEFRGMNITSLNASEVPEVARSFYRRVFSALNSKALSTILAPDYHCVQCPGLRFAYSMLDRGIIYAVGKKTGTRMKCLSLSRKKIAATIADIAPVVAMRDAASVIRLLNTPLLRGTHLLMRAATCFGRTVNVSSMELQVPTLFNIVIEQNEVQIRPNRIKKENAVKFYLLKYGRKEEFKNKLVFYVHGGAFVGPKAGVLNNFFVKGFSNNLKGLTILSMDHSPGPEAAFPVAAQQVLDTYLWLTSGRQDVLNKIGFHPEEIVLLGDSSGGNLVSSLLVTLNEIRRMGLGFKPFMPRSMVLCWPKASLQYDLFFSLMSSMFDSLLSMQLLLAACIAYVPMLKRDENGNWILITDNDSIPLDFLLREDYKVIESPILSPVNYPHMNQLADVQLGVLALGNDPLLDESLEMARKWKGDVRLHVLEGAAHGGFIFNYFSREGSRCVAATTDMLRHAFSNP